jgi:hypothetical protein
MQPKTPGRLEDRIVAAIETGIRLRRPDPSAGPADPVDSLMDMIESEAARIRGNDLSALSAILGHQILALDAIFTEVAKKSAAGDIVLYDPLRLALKAQSQSRAALDSLVAVARPRATGQRSNAEGISGEQTAANRNSPSR